MRILVAVDRSACSRRAVRYVIKHLRAFGKKPDITLLNVDFPLPGRLQPVIGPEEVARYHHERSKAVLKAAEGVLKRARIPYREKLLIGDPGATIAWVAKDEHCDLIVLGSRGEGALTRLILGSVVTKVIAQSKIPVLIVH